VCETWSFALRGKQIEDVGFTKNEATRNGANYKKRGLKNYACHPVPKHHAMKTYGGVEE
jgi:hypothetical protein